MNGSSIDWTEYKDEDIQRFIRELEAEQNRRRAEKRKALKAQISDRVHSLFFRRVSAWSLLESLPVAITHSLKGAVVFGTT